MEHYTGYTHSSLKVQPLRAPPPIPMLEGPRDLDAEAVANLPPSESGGHSPKSSPYAPSTPLANRPAEGQQVTLEGVRADGDVMIGDAQHQVLQGQHAVELGASVLPLPPLPPEDMDLEVDKMRGEKHKSATQGGPTSSKALKMDDDPAVDPKRKAAKTEVRMVANVEVCHNDELGLEEEWNAYPQDFHFEDDEISQRTEGEGPPNVSEEKLRELDGVAALEEVQKLFDLDVIEPVKVNFNEVAPECVVDTTTAADWRFREGVWRRRVRIVAREFRANQQTDEASFSPTSAAAAIRCLLVLSMCFSLDVCSVDVKDADLKVPQQEVMYVMIPGWIRNLNPESDCMVAEKVPAGPTKWSTSLVRVLPKQMRDSRTLILRWKPNNHEAREQQP